MQENSEKQKGSKKLLSSEPLMESPASEDQTTNQSEDSPSWIVCSSAKELKFDKFIKICCENKLDLLIVEGVPPLAAILQAWIDIQTEYNEIIDPTFSVSLEDKTHIELLRAKAKVVGAIVEHLKIRHEEDLAGYLKTFGFRYKFDPSNQEEYLKNLNSVVTKTKGWVYQIAAYDKENEQPEGAKKKVTEEQFTQMLRAMSKYMGFQVRAYDYTVFEFAVNFRDMQRELAKAPKIENNGG